LKSLLPYYPSLKIPSEKSDPNEAFPTAFWTIWAFRRSPFAQRVVESSDLDAIPKAMGSRESRWVGLFQVVLGRVEQIFLFNLLFRNALRRFR